MLIPWQIKQVCLIPWPHEQTEQLQLRRQQNVAFYTETTATTGTTQTN